MAGWRLPRDCVTRAMGFTKVVDDFAAAVANASSMDELSCSLAAIALELGFHYFALTHHVDVPRAPKPAIRLHNYPDGWAAYFDAERLGPSDPVHRASHLTAIGFAWSRLPALIELTPRDRDILERARHSGLGEGFTVPAHIPGESAGSCSFATLPGRGIPSERLHLAQLVGGLAFEAARRLVAIRTPAPHRPRLTDRQRDCLYWAARGKTDWEIAGILKLSHETVIQYVKQARDRYGVSKRTQLAVHALFDGTLTFIDLLRR